MGAVGIAAGIGYLAVADDALMRLTIGVSVLVGVALTVSGIASPPEDGQVTATPGARRRARHGSGVCRCGGERGRPSRGAVPLGQRPLRPPVRRDRRVVLLLGHLIKAPFSAGLGLLSREALLIDAALLPALALGAWLGTVVIKRISQVTFRRVIIIITTGSAIAMLI